jgi:hypothetical protein
LIQHTLKLNGFYEPYCQLKWIFSGFVASAKSLSFLNWHSHAKMAPDKLGGGRLLTKTELEQWEHNIRMLWGHE